MPPTPLEGSLLHPDELALTDRKGLLGMVYLRAVAAVAGYGLAEPSPDRDSVDATIYSSRGRRQRLDFQVKCTSLELEGDQTTFPFDLSLKNYNDLRADTVIPRYLLVVLVPRPPGEWLKQNERRMHLRRCGYYASLRGGPPTKNQTAVRIQVERRNLLSASTLGELMRRGELG